MRYLIILSAILVSLSACSKKYGGFGMPGSPAWKATATEAQKQRYYQDQIAGFRQQCESYGFTDPVQLAACIERERHADLAASRARKADMQRTFDNLQESNRQQYENNMNMYNSSRPVSCNRIGNSVTCHRL
jgi:hypothetical protein